MTHTKQTPKATMAADSTDHRNRSGRQANHPVNGLAAAIRGGDHNQARPRSAVNARPRMSHTGQAANTDIAASVTAPTDQHKRCAVERIGDFPI
jgi:hypothetical protein